MKQNEKSSSLAPYRVLDLSDEKGFMCGKMLADLGAEVIKVERPLGDVARNKEPFYKDKNQPDKSLYWFAYNSGKKSITVNIESPAGKNLFHSLLSVSDIMLESFPPGYLANISLSYEKLREINPKIILTSITPFGQLGPYSNYRDSDLINMAMGGYIYICGDADRPPVRVSVDQSYHIAGAQAAMGTLLALRHRNMTGKGQQVDVSIQESITCCITIEVAFWQAQKYVARRMGIRRRRGANNARDLWPCKDGYIGWRLLGAGLGSKTMRALIAWMESEDKGHGLRNIDWDTIDMTEVTQDEMEKWEAEIIEFFRQHTKAEIYEKALQSRMLMCPEFTPDELLRYEQLNRRNFWVEVDYPYLQDKVVQPGEFCKMGATPLCVNKHAPSIGEHNEEIFNGLIGLPLTEIEELKKKGVI